MSCQEEVVFAWLCSVLKFLQRDDAAIEDSMTSITVDFSMRFLAI